MPIINFRTNPALVDATEFFAKPTDNLVFIFTPEKLSDASDEHVALYQRWIKLPYIYREHRIGRKAVAKSRLGASGNLEQKSRHSHSFTFTFFFAVRSRI